MDYRILGPIEVADGDGVLPLGSGRQRALLALLLLHPDEALSTERIVDALWDGSPPPTAAKSLQNTVVQLRRVLRADAADGDPPLRTEGGGYALRVLPGERDLDRFEALLEEGRRARGDGDPERAAERLRAALALWRGTPLADVMYEPFAQAEVARLEDRRLTALEERIEADLACGRHEDVVGELETEAGRHPLRERLRGQLMLALYRSGRQAQALEAFQDARRTLAEEVGIEPGPELRRLQEAVLRQDPELDAPRRAPRAPPLRGAEGRPGRGAGGRRTRLLLVGAGVALLAGLLAFGVDRLAAPERLDGIEEDAVGLIDPDDAAVFAQYAVGRGPDAVVAGAGSVWVANGRDGTVSRVDRGRDQVVTIDVGGDPSGLAFGAGALWVADADRRRLVQVDPGTNRVTRRLPTGNLPRGVAVGYGAVWTASALDGTVTRIDLERGGPPRRTVIPGGPTALATGAGAVWVASESTGTVHRIDPQTGAVLRTTGVGRGPAALTVGGGAVWVANRQDGTVSRLDPATDAVTGTARVGTEPTALAVDDDGTWVANAGDGAVVRVAPDASRVVERVSVGSSPSGLAVSGGALWASALPPRAAHRGGTLRVAAGGAVLADPGDPASYTPESWELMSLVYDGLVAYRRTGGAAGSELVGDLATEVPRPSEAGRVYAFRLRPGLRYSDGTPVRARDFRASMETHLRAFRGTPPFYNRIVGARACLARPATCDLSDGVETDERARTVTIRLTSPDAELPHKLAVPLAFVRPADVTRSEAREGRLPGTGPYRVASYGGGRRVRLVRNPRFESWSSDARPDGFADEIIFETGADDRARADAVRTGRGDLAPLGDLSHRWVRTLALRYPGRLRVDPVLHTDWLALNVRAAPFDDPRVRRAVALAVDRGRLAARFGPQVAQPTCQILPPGLPGYRPRCPFTVRPSPAGAWTAPDLERARELVRASGTRGTPVDVRAPAFGREAGREAAAVLRRLGYPTRLTVLPEEEYFASAGGPDTGAEAMVTGWVADYVTPAAVVQPNFSCESYLPRSAANNNYSRYCDPALDAMVERARAAEGAEAGALWERVDRRLVAELPAVPLVNRRAVAFLSARLGNYQHHPLYGALLDQLWVR